MFKTVRSGTGGTAPIVLNPTSKLFAARHRIRLDISSSHYPRLDLNPNSSGPLGEPAPMIVAHNAIYKDVDHTSRTVLRVVPG